MSSSFDSDVRRRREHTPWANVDLLAFAHEVALNDQTKEMGILLPKPMNSEVLVRIVYRHAVSSRFWYSIEWVGCDGEKCRTDSQYFDLMLWRAAEFEMSTREKIAREDAKAKHGLYMGKVMLTPWHTEVEIKGLSYDPTYRRNIASVRFLEDCPGHIKDGIGYFALDDLREVKRTPSTS